jgi:hypothetical protein
LGVTQACVSIWLKQVEAKLQEDLAELAKRTRIAQIRQLEKGVEWCTHVYLDSLKPKRAVVETEDEAGRIVRRVQLVPGKGNLDALNERRAHLTDIAGRLGLLTPPKEFNALTLSDLSQELAAEEPRPQNAASKAHGSPRAPRGEAGV